MAILHDRPSHENESVHEVPFYAVVRQHGHGRTTYTHSRTAAMPIWPFNRRNAGPAPLSATVDSSEEGFSVVSILSPDETRSLGGLPNEAIAGAAGRTGTSETFRLNPRFVEHMHQVIREVGPGDRDLLEALSWRDYRTWIETRRCATGTRSVSVQFRGPFRGRKRGPRVISAISMYSAIADAASG